jgi:hypothetical protein
VSVRTILIGAGAIAAGALLAWHLGLADRTPVARIIDKVTK